MGSEKGVHFRIQATKDAKLSNVSRSLNEEQPLIKNEGRLSRNLDDVDFTDGINGEICRLGAYRVLDDMVIALDPGDIRKKYARKMEYLCGNHDGSENELGNGYWPCKCVAPILIIVMRFPFTVRLSTRPHFLSLFLAKLDAKKSG